MIAGDLEKVEQFATLLKDYRVGITAATGVGINCLKKRSLVEQYVGVMVPNVVTIREPVQARNKGSGKRIKRSAEMCLAKKKKGTSKCSRCGKYATHNSRICEQSPLKGEESAETATNEEEDDE